MRYFVVVNGAKIYDAYEGTSGKKAEEILHLVINTLTACGGVATLEYKTSERFGRMNIEKV
jgi:hypothetical protein